MDHWTPPFCLRGKGYERLCLLVLVLGAARALWWPTPPKGTARPRQTPDGGAGEGPNPPAAPLAGPRLGQEIRKKENLYKSSQKVIEHQI